MVADRSQIMGSCFFVSGMKYRQQSFNDFATRSISALNLIALCCLLIPSTLYRVTVGRGTFVNDLMLVMLMSRGIAIMLLVLYILYLFQRLRSHADLYSNDQESEVEMGSTDAVNLSLRPIAAIVWVAACLICVTVCVEAVVSNIPNSTWEAKKVFLSFVLFPFLGNVTDYMSACTVALKDEMDITILNTIGSSMQLLLFTLPVLVILGWIINEPMTLLLDTFEMATVFLGVYIVNKLVQDGRSNFMTGAMCIAL